MKESEILNLLKNSQNVIIFYSFHASIMNVIQFLIEKNKWFVNFCEKI